MKDNKLRVLIVEDTIEHVEWAKSALLPGLSQSKVDTEKAAKISDELYNIDRCENYDDTIEYLNSNVSIDLAILDIDLSNSSDSKTLKSKYFDFSKLKNGINLIEPIKSHCPYCVIVLFTAQASDLDINKQIVDLQLKVNEDIFLKSPKSYGGGNLNYLMKNILQKVARKFFEQLDSSEINALIYQNENKTEKFMHDYEVSLGLRQIKLRDIFVYASNFDSLVLRKNSHDLRVEVKNVIESLDKKFEFKGYGIWKKKNVKKLIQEFRENVNYFKWLQLIEHSAMYHILVLYSKFKNKKCENKPIDIVPLDKYNFQTPLINNPSIYNTKLRVYFIRALVTRRVFIFLFTLNQETRLLNMSELGTELLNHIKGTENKPRPRESLVKEITTNLGFKAEMTGLPQRIEVVSPFIMPEEKIWLKENYSSITEKLAQLK